MPGLSAVYYRPGRRFNIVGQQSLRLLGIGLRYVEDDDTFVVTSTLSVDYYFLKVSIRSQVCV